MELTRSQDPSLTALVDEREGTLEDVGEPLGSNELAVRQLLVGRQPGLVEVLEHVKPSAVVGGQRVGVKRVPLLWREDRLEAPVTCATDADHAPPADTVRKASVEMTLMDSALR